MQKVAVVGSRWHFFSRLYAISPATFYADPHRESLWTDRCESKFNLIIHRKRLRQTAAWKKPGHLEMGAWSAIRMASLVFWQ